MSSLYYKGRVVYISFLDGRRWRNRSLGIKAEHPTKRNGKWVFPAEARRVQMKIDEELAMGKFGLKRQAQAPRISELLERYLAHRSGMIVATTVREYKTILGHLIDFAGDIPVDEVDEVCIAAFRAKLLQTYKQNTVANILRHIRAVFQFAVKKCGLQKNIIDDYRVAPAATEPVVFTKDELVSFFTKAKESDIDLFRQTLCLLLTGFRASESCQLRWDQIGEGVIRHKNVKGKRVELMPIDAALESLFAGTPHTYEPYVFRYRPKHNLAYAFNRVKKATGIRAAVTLHAFKRTYANTLYETAGDDLLSVQDLVHHKNFQTTREAYLTHRRLDVKRAVLSASRREIEAVVMLQRDSGGS